VTTQAPGASAVTGGTISEAAGRLIAAARWIVRNGLAVWVIVAALVALMVVRRGGAFLSEQNVSDVLSQSVTLGLVALGQTFVVISGGIDLSVGSLASLTTVLAAGMINGHSLFVFPVLFLMMALGAGVGLAHGYFVTHAGIAPFVVTLATYFILQGFGFAYTTIPVGSMPIGVSNFFYSHIGPIPWIFVILVVIGVLLAGVLAKTRFGRHVYAVGGNPTIARAVGIKVARVTILCYVISGVLAAVVGYLLAARAGLGAPSAGSGLELSAIATVVLGGASLAGGRGRVLGTAGGVALLSLIQNAFSQLSISSFYQSFVLGAVIVAAVAIFVRRD
jgi:ribose transport system permease protein